MKTITFYSYKGGVGRSLALVNIATRLVEFGKKVCVIDFDLEAPGLHLKFPTYLNSTKSKGIVDYVYQFSNKGILDKDIKNYTTELPISPNGKTLSLITAGDTKSADYWKKLSSIDWYYLIYENPNGLAFFLNLITIIKKEINPDFLLIDSRTGISEMSGITLSLMADEVVIIAANNKENLSGASRIIKSLNNPDNSILGKIPNINFVLSRVPFTDKPEDRAKELHLINRIRREYLNPLIDEVNIIHSDRELEEFERVKIAYERDEPNTQISIDYLKLFERLTKTDLSENEIRRFKNIRQSERLMVLANSSDGFNKKLEYVNKAIDLNKSNIDFYMYRANLNMEVQDYQVALEDLNKILSLNQNYVPALNLIIEIYISQRKLSEAIMQADYVLKLRPSEINVLLSKIEIYTLWNRYSDAEDIANKLIEMVPELSSAYSARGNVRRLRKNFDDALVDVFKALELFSDNLQAIGTLAEIYAETGKHNEFYYTLETVIKMDSSYAKACINDEEIYKTFYNEPRFVSLLAKYEIYINEI